MDQTFHTGQDLHEGTVIGDDNDLSFDLVAHAEVLVGQLVPWMRFQLLDAQLNARLAFVEVQNNDIDLLVELQHF